MGPRDLTLAVVDDRPEEVAALFAEGGVPEAVDEGVGGAVEVVGPQTEGIEVVTAVCKVVAQVHWPVGCRPEKNVGRHRVYNRGLGIVMTRASSSSS